MYLGHGGRGRLAAEMRVRAATLIAIFGIALVPGISGAAQPISAPSLHVSVKPASGSRTTHFVIGFKSAQTTGPIGSGHDLYRLTASVKSQGGGCQSSVSAVAPPSHAGATVHVTLAPAAHRGWCAGTFRGQVWNVLTEPCPVGRACPAIQPLPRVVGKFTFRVKRG